MMVHLIQHIFFSSRAEPIVYGENLRIKKTRRFLFYHITYEKTHTRSKNCEVTGDVKQATQKSIQ